MSVELRATPWAIPLPLAPTRPHPIGPLFHSFPHPLVIPSLPLPNQIPDPPDPPNFITMSTEQKVENQVVEQVAEQKPASQKRTKRGSPIQMKLYEERLAKRAAAAGITVEEQREVDAAAYVLKAADRKAQLEQRAAAAGVTVAELRATERAAAAAKNPRNKAAKKGADVQQPTDNNDPVLATITRLFNSDVAFKAMITQQVTQYEQIAAITRMGAATKAKVAAVYKQ